MAFTPEYSQNQRWHYFEFYTTGGVDGLITESATFTAPWKLAEIKIRCSTAFASVADFMVEVSSVNGSYYNLNLLSQAMNTVQDVLFQPDREVQFFSDDTLNISFATVSGANVIGISVSGWAALG